MPDLDLRKLSKEDLEKILEAGENGSGYKVYQAAGGLRGRRNSLNPTIKAKENSKDFVLDLTDEQFDLVQSVLKN